MDQSEFRTGPHIIYLIASHTAVTMSYIFVIGCLLILMATTLSAQSTSVAASTPAIMSWIVGGLANCSTPALMGPILSPIYANTGCYPLYQGSASYTANCHVAIDEYGIAQLINANFTYWERSGCTGSIFDAYAWYGPIPAQAVSQCATATYLGPSGPLGTISSQLNCTPITSNSSFRRNTSSLQFVALILLAMMFGLM